MTTIKIVIKDCRGCPFFKSTPAYTEDSFERPEDWFCGKKNGKKIAGYVDWNDKVEVPKWCPIKVD